MCSEASSNQLNQLHSNEASIIANPTLTKKDFFVVDKSYCPGMIGEQQCGGRLLCGIYFHDPGLNWLWREARFSAGG